MKELLLHPYWSALVIFMTQIIFLYFRTLNVQYVSEHRVLASIITGNLVAVSWLISVGIGVSAIMELEPLVITANLAGGSLGTWLGFKLKK